MFIENKYTIWYYKIISAARGRTVNGYIERHHIIPKSMGGDNSSTNLVKLTAREHFICHRLLTKMVTGIPKRKMLQAVWCFTRSSNNQSRHIINSRTYGIIREELSKTLSLERKGIMHKGRKFIKRNSWVRGVTHSEETKAKMRESWKSRPPRTQEHKDAIATAGLGRKASEETKRKMSETRKGKNPIQTQVPFICEHCGKEGVGVSNYKRWHGSNCRILK